MFSNWFKTTFESFKDSLIDEGCFDQMKIEFEKFWDEIEFTNLMKESNDSSGSYCGISFKKDQLLYHCR